MWQKIGRLPHAWPTGVALLALALGSGAALAASPVDGTYAGTSVLTRGVDTGRCGKDFRTRVTVANGGFDLEWDRKQNIVVPIRIAADGTVSGSNFRGKNTAGASAAGHLTGKVLEIDITGKECARHLSLRKRG